jgi:glycosyltransferase involved in cell wall biosynthesis
MGSQQQQMLRVFRSVTSVVNEYRPAAFLVPVYKTSRYYCMKILVYDDSLDFGGHQVMASRGIEALSADPGLRVVFMAHSRNRQLWKQVQHIPNLELVDTACATRRLQGIRNRFSAHDIRTLANRFRDYAPDAVLSIQGDIEQSSLSVLAANRCGIPCISYMAIPHRLRDMGARLGALRDRLNRYLINRPDRYITVSESMKQRLLERGVTRPVTVVANGTDPADPVRQSDPSMFPVLGVFGRIEFSQKQQNFMLSVFNGEPDAFRDCRLLFAGSGPDETKLNRLISGSPRADDITLTPWTDNMKPLYQQIDYLIIPSRYEGVPLVMLEALVRGIPVIASACDGMRDILPEDWLFETGSAAALAETFSAVRRGGWKDIESLQKKTASDMSSDRFGERFAAAVKGTGSLHR